MISLPSLEKRFKPTTILVLGTIYYFIVYLGSGHFYLGEPWSVPIHYIDTIVSFNPFFIWIYFISYVYLFIAFIISPNRDKAAQFIYCFLLLTTISSIIFFIFPTTVPRHEFVIPEDAFFLTKLSFQILRTIDVPNNCIPSLHVSTSVITALFIREVLSKKAFLSSMFISMMITYSTMATKQHFFYDCVTGAFIGYICFILIFKFTIIKHQ